MQPGITQYVQNQRVVHPTCQVLIIDLLSLIVVETGLDGAGTQLGVVFTVMSCGPAMMTVVHAVSVPACSWRLYTYNMTSPANPTNPQDVHNDVV